MYMNRGQYAVRGSIIDVFSLLRISFIVLISFGDEVESIRRTFEVESQLSCEKKKWSVHCSRFSSDRRRDNFLSGFYPERYYSGNARFSLVA